MGFTPLEPVAHSKQMASLCDPPLLPKILIKIKRKQEKNQPRRQLCIYERKFYKPEGTVIHDTDLNSIRK